MKYRYEDLNDTLFEKLVIAICQFILGMSTKGFTTGKDQGRDAKFTGKANEIPSASKPWDGKVIVQAKHTNGFNKSFSESDFFGVNSKTATINKEIERVKKLIGTKKLDYYMLFANRKLTAHYDDIITSYISENTGLEETAIYLCDINQIEMWLNLYPKIANNLDIKPANLPLTLCSDEIAEVIEAFNHQKDNGVFDTIEKFPEPRTTLQRKNKLNNLSEEYSKYLKSIVIKESIQIKDFLADPRNKKLNDLYQLSVEEFKTKIIAHRMDFESFDKVLNYIFDLLVNRDAILRKYKRLTRVMLYYMYWNCDIGENDDKT